MQAKGPANADEFPAMPGILRSLCDTLRVSGNRAKLGKSTPAPQAFGAGNLGTLDPARFPRSFGVTPAGKTGEKRENAPIRAMRRRSPPEAVNLIKPYTAPEHDGHAVLTNVNSQVASGRHAEVKADAKSRDACGGIFWVSVPPKESEGA
jgi:hypothetical protein